MFFDNLEKGIHRIIRLLNKKPFRLSQSTFFSNEVISPSEDLKKLIRSATKLEDVWDFLVDRLSQSSEPAFVMLSIVDEVAELVRVRFFYSVEPNGEGFEGEIVPLCDTENHIVATLLRKDTTFTNQPQALGVEIQPYINHFDQSAMQVFSTPLVAGGSSVAVITVGFESLDAFSPAKLSYVYTLREQLAQLIWNLMLKEQLENQPQLDNLTGLMTYSSFLQVLKKELKRCQFQNNQLGLLLIDMNNLKDYNERYSPQMGDRAIAWLASALKHEVRGIDTLARFGNDEVVVILPDIHEEEVNRVVDKIIKAVNRPHKGIKPFTVSIGVSLFPQDAQEVDELIQLSENALDYLKSTGVESLQHCSVVFAKDLDTLDDTEKSATLNNQISKKHKEGQSSLFERLTYLIETDEMVTDENPALQAIATIIKLVEKKDPYLKEHARSVADYSVAIAVEMNLSSLEVEQVRLAGLLHDVGIVGVPDAILNKPEVLTEAEMAIVKEHPILGARHVVEPVEELKDIVPLIEHHHERWDGTGYPFGLKGENIPLGARIIAIADAFHALTRDRPFRDALPIEEAVNILNEGSGLLWDPQLVNVFIEVLQKSHWPAVKSTEKV